MIGGNTTSVGGDEPRPKLISDEMRTMVELINGVYLSSAISVLGIVGNVFTMAVFVKQGLQSTINISFTMLAFSDLASLITLLWYNVCGSPEFMTSGAPFVFAEVKHLTAGFPHACFSRVTSWVTVYITAERFLSVAFPLKIKRMITPRKAAGVIFVIYAVMILSLLPEYSTVYLTWGFYPSLNKTLLGLVFTNNRTDFEGVSLLLYAAFMVVSFFGITSLTIGLLVVFKRSVKWRRSTSTAGSDSQKSMTREKKTIKLVLVMATVYTAMFTPTVACLAVGLSLPGFDFVGEYSNFFFVTFSFGFTLDAVNSSTRIILYYTMSSAFRHTLQEILYSKKQY